MTSEIGALREATADDLDRIQALRAQAFMTSNDQSANLPNLRVIELDGVVQGVVATIPFGTYLGGRSVVSHGIASVAVAAEARGQGVGGALVTQALQSIENAGSMLAVLYPSTLPAYRKHGFELAGTWTRYEAPIPALPTQRGVTVEAWGDADYGAVAACYSRFAQGQSGMIDRTEAWWRGHSLRQPGDKPLFRYLVREGGEVTGYLIFTQEAFPGALPYFHEVRCRDLVWLTEGAGRALLAFAASDRGLGRLLTWAGPPSEPLALFVEELDVRSQASYSWLARVVNVPGALGARGYPDAVNVEFSFTVHDPLFAANAQSFHVAVANGRATVEPSTAAGAEVDAGALAAIFTGWLDAEAAARAGRLRGDHACITAMSAAFGGPRPWMMEVF